MSSSKQRATRLTRIKVNVPTDGLNTAVLVEGSAVVASGVLGLEWLLKAYLDLLPLHPTVRYLTLYTYFYIINQNDASACGNKATKTYSFDS